MVALLFPYGKDCWRPFHYRIAESLILVPNIDQMYKEMKKIQTRNRSLINPFQLNAHQKASISQQSSVYCWSRKRRRFSGFCRSIIFFGIKNVRVGGNILGSVGRSETHIFFYLALVEETGEPEKNKNLLHVTDTKGYIQYNLTCE